MRQYRLNSVIHHAGMAPPDVLGEGVRDDAEPRVAGEEGSHHDVEPVVPLDMLLSGPPPRRPILAGLIHDEQQAHLDGFKLHIGSDPEHLGVHPVGVVGQESCTERSPQGVDLGVHRTPRPGARLALTTRASGTRHSFIHATIA
jgi:hypothetical protein